MLRPQGIIRRTWYYTSGPASSAVIPSLIITESQLRRNKVYLGRTWHRPALLQELRKWRKESRCRGQKHLAKMLHSRCYLLLPITLPKRLGPSTMGVMRALKDTLDPHWLLNPGKIFDE
ncbi:D-lactate dehydrogenase [cytochrome], mitochondrial [Tolypocladium capitatum]|uniref:D-lactate dehydrogenase [cytochrome], mitochondrial n=1 Tax=Tolypocladium capitatum TaxID=45235 RepID=A0A2K3QIB2_9HYPO|nr:D-lactate dehydrogenase [cytochrome], mitochondrial [Tolypocladium capitatum]